MTDSQKKKYGAWLIAAGAVLLAISAAETPLERLLPTLPHYVASLLAVLGISGVVAGAALWLISFLKMPMTWKDYECHKARLRDLDLVYKFAKKHFGEDVSSLETMRRWYGKNPSVFFVIITEQKDSFKFTRQMVGYFCAIPLTENSLAKIESGEVKGREIPNEYIARRSKECAAVYIGGIAAEGRGAKAALLAVLNKQFKPSNKWAKTFYTRPITPAGLRIALKKEFKAIDPLNHGKMGAIYKLELELK